MLGQAQIEEEPVDFHEPEEGDDIADDYATGGFTLWRHSLALIRPKLSGLGIRTAEEFRSQARDRQQVLTSGIVTHRKQPSTSNGVILATLEDETEMVNIIVWPSIAEAQRKALRGSVFPTGQGTLNRPGFCGGSTL